MHELYENMVLEFDYNTPQPSTRRVLWLPPPGMHAWTICLSDRRAKVHRELCDQLEQALVSGSARRIPEPHAKLALPEKYYSAARRKERDANYDALRILFEAPPEQRFDIHSRSNLIREITSRDKSDIRYREKSGVYELWRRYCQRGQTRNALLSDRHHAGWSSRQRAEHPPTRKLGRSYLAIDDVQKRAGLVLIPALEATLYSIAQLFWECRDANGRKRTWGEARDLGCQRFFRLGYEVTDGVRRAIMPPDSALPSVPQIRRVYFGRTNFDEMIRAREGERVYNLQYRPLTHDQRSLAFGPMRVVQVDSTVADAYLVHVHTERS